MERNLKLALAVLLLVCLLDMPYGYYQLVRYVAAASFVFLGFRERERGSANLAFLLFALAFLFQPFLKIPLGRAVWNIVDLVVGVGLILSALRDKTAGDKTSN